MELSKVRDALMAREKHMVVAVLLAGGLSLLGIGFSKISAESEPAGAMAKRIPHIDLAFCIDTTGSMQGELDAVKSKTKEIVAQLSGSKPIPVVRVAVVAFRDRGDEYVTKVFPFTEDIDKVVKDIQELQANGGGDAPEAVNEALHSAVHELKWSADKKTVKQLFLIGDAGPNHYPGDFQWETECREAIGQGIQINTVACDGLASDDNQVFQKIAKLTDGTAEVLTYRQEIVNAHGKKETIITSAGETFSLKGDGAAWREGASALRARGLAAPLPPVTMGKAVARASYGTDAGYAAAADVGISLRSMSSAGGGGMAASLGTNRSDSNLADIVLKKTKAAMEEKASQD